MAAAFLEHRREVVAASTLQRDEGVCASLPAWLRAHRVCDVNPQVISRLIKSINGSPGTKQRALITVAAFFSWLEGLAVVDRNPVRGIRIPRTNAIGAATNPFSWREVETIAPEGPYGDVIIVLAYTGLRWGELRALRARDVVIDDDGIATALRVRRSASDGFPEKAPRAGRSGRFRSCSALRSSSAAPAWPETRRPCVYLPAGWSAQPQQHETLGAVGRDQRRPSIP